MSSGKPGILLIGNYPPPFGGVPTHLKYLSEHLDARGWQVHVLPAYFREHGLQRVGDSVFVHRPTAEDRFGAFFDKRNRIAGFRSRRHLYASSREYVSAHTQAAYIKKVALDHDVRIIGAYHVFGYATNGAVISEDLGIPMITTIFGEIYSDTAQFRDRIGEVEYVAKHTARWLSCSDHCARSMQLLGLPIQVDTLHYGIDVDHFRPDRSGRAIRERCGVADTDRVVIFVGRMKREMGLHVLLEAIPILMERRQDVHFLVVGSSGELTKDARALGVRYPGRVHVLAELPYEELPLAYAASDLAVAPSISARACLGLAIAEALATAKPAIGCDAGGTREVLIDGDVGLLVPPEDPAALARAVVELLDDDARRRAMGERGREHVVGQFDKDVTNRRMEEIIHEIIGSSGLRPSITNAQPPGTGSLAASGARILARATVGLIEARDSVADMVGRPKAESPGGVRGLVLRFVPRRVKAGVRALVKGFVAGELRRQDKTLRAFASDLRAVRGVVARESYDRIRNTNVPVPLGDFEHRVYSQNGEDGVIAHLVSAVGAKTFRFVEFGIGDGIECNAANLALNLGWGGLMMEGNPEKAERAREFYDRKLPDAGRVRIEHRLVTAENINELLAELGAEGELDLLSIDIDGNDYWVWKAMHILDPRVVVIEYNASLGPDKSLTVKYDPGFVRRRKHSSGFYHGASLTALTKLGAEKSYALVGCESMGVNAFFVRRDLLGGAPILEVSPEEAWRPHHRRCKTTSTEDQYATVAHLPFVAV